MLRTFWTQSSSVDSGTLWKRRLYSREYRSRDSSLSRIPSICLACFGTELSISSTLHHASWSSPLSYSKLSLRVLNWLDILPNAISFSVTLAFKFEMSWMICFWPLLSCPSDSRTNVSKSSSSATSAGCFCFPLLVADIVYIKDLDMKN